MSPGPSVSLTATTHPTNSPGATDKAAWGAGPAGGAGQGGFPVCPHMKCPLHIRLTRAQRPGRSQEQDPGCGQMAWLTGEGSPTCGPPSAAAVSTCPTCRLLHTCDPDAQSWGRGRGVAPSAASTLRTKPPAGLRLRPGALLTVSLSGHPPEHRSLLLESRLVGSPGPSGSHASRATSRPLSAPGSPPTEAWAAAGPKSRPYGHLGVSTSTQHRARHLPAPAPVRAPKKTQPGRAGISPVPTTHPSLHVPRISSWLVWSPRDVEDEEKTTSSGPSPGPTPSAWQAPSRSKPWAGLGQGRVVAPPGAPFLDRRPVHRSQNGTGWVPRAIQNHGCHGLTAARTQGSPRSPGRSSSWAPPTPVRPAARV